MTKQLYTERRDYDALTLSRTDLRDDPHDLFDQWMQDALKAAMLDTTAMTLATIDSNGTPQARVVLLKDYSANGFVWFTNTGSDKGKELAQHPQATLLFYWRPLERQVRITGTVTTVSAEESADYFHSRPEESRFSAAASDQSAPVENRHVLEEKVQALHEQYPDGDVPCPASWGGYRLTAERFEFWQGRPSRLHDRFVYCQDDAGAWAATRLQP